MISKISYVVKDICLTVALTLIIFMGIGSLYLYKKDYSEQLPLINAFLNDNLSGEMQTSSSLNFTLLPKPSFVLSNVFVEGSTDTFDYELTSHKIYLSPKLIPLIFRKEIRIDSMKLHESSIDVTKTHYVENTQPSDPSSPLKAEEEFGITNKLSFLFANKSFRMSSLELSNTQLHYNNKQTHLEYTQYFQQLKADFSGISKGLISINAFSKDHLTNSITNYIMHMAGNRKKGNGVVKIKSDTKDLEINFNFQSKKNKIYFMKGNLNYTTDNMREDAFTFILGQKIISNSHSSEYQAHKGYIKADFSLNKSILLINNFETSSSLLDGNFIINVDLKKNISSIVADIEKIDFNVLKKNDDQFISNHTAFPNLGGNGTKFIYNLKFKNLFLYNFDLKNVNIFIDQVNQTKNSNYITAELHNNKITGNIYSLSKDGLNYFKSNLAINSNDYNQFLKYFDIASLYEKGQQNYNISLDFLLSRRLIALENIYFSHESEKVFGNIYMKYIDFYSKPSAEHDSEESDIKDQLYWEKYANILQSDITEYDPFYVNLIVSSLNFDKYLINYRGEYYNNISDILSSKIYRLPKDSSELKFLSRQLLHTLKTPFNRVFNISITNSIINGIKVKKHAMTLKHYKDSLSILIKLKSELNEGAIETTLTLKDFIPALNIKARANKLNLNEFIRYKANDYKWDFEFESLPILSNIQGSLDIKSKSLSYRKIEITDSNIQANLKDSVIKTDKFYGKLFNRGYLGVNLEATMDSYVDLKLDYDIRNAPLSLILNSVADTNKIGGQVSIKGDLKTTGENNLSLTQNLRMNAQGTLINPYIIGIGIPNIQFGLLELHNIPKTALKNFDYLYHKDKTVFLDGDFQLRAFKNFLYIKALNMRSDQASLSGITKINLLDYSIKSQNRITYNGILRKGVSIKTISLFSDIALSGHIYAPVMKANNQSTKAFIEEIRKIYVSKQEQKSKLIEEINKIIAEKNQIDKEEEEFQVIEQLNEEEGTKAILFDEFNSLPDEEIDRLINEAKDEDL